MAVFETATGYPPPRSAAEDVLEADAYLQCSPEERPSPCSASHLPSVPPWAMLACLNSQSHAAQCGNSAAGFESWKQPFAGEARGKGVSASDHRRP